MGRYFAPSTRYIALILPRAKGVSISSLTESAPESTLTTVRRTFCASWRTLYTRAENSPAGSYAVRVSSDSASMNSPTPSPESAAPA